MIYADYTHSLLGALVLSGIFGGVGAIAWNRRTGLVLAAVAFSHWLLKLERQMEGLARPEGFEPPTC